jgi:prephenate dehydrogenase
LSTRPEVAIVGLGLVGGSLARALSGGSYKVIGIDRPSVLKRVLKSRIQMSTSPNLSAALEADLIVLAAPPEANISLLRTLSTGVAPTTIVTDLGSVKGPICAEARACGLASFVGGHPMAGSERSGFAASTADLFRGNPWILTPNGAPPRALAAVRALTRAVGARTHLMSPREHDRAVAFLSHMPQIVSWAIAAAAGGDPVAGQHLRLAGSGFKDMTRLARSSRSLWLEILGQNDKEVVRAIRSLKRALSQAFPRPALDGRVRSRPGAGR